MATIKPRKYKNSVYIIYAYKLGIFKIYTGVKIDDKYWNIDTPRKNCPEYDKVTNQIAEVESRVLNASLAVRARELDPTAELVRKEYYDQIAIAKKERGFGEDYNTYLELLTCRENTRQKIAVTRNVFEYFCNYIEYSPSRASFDKVMFGKFVQYLLRNQKMADSTVHPHVKWLKAFFRFSYPEKDVSFMKYSMPSTDKEIIALNEEELNQLMEANLTGYLDKARDLFVFLATTGMRFNDSQRFDPSWITPEHIIEFTQHKTSGKAFSPLYEVAQKILNKYGGTQPVISNQKFNDHLKELFKELEMNRPITLHITKAKVVYQEIKPLSSVISSHAALRTFISICLQKGMPIQDVMKMSRHSNYKSMKPYMRITRRHLRDVADKWEI